MTELSIRKILERLMIVCMIAIIISEFSCKTASSQLIENVTTKETREGLEGQIHQQKEAIATSSSAVALNISLDNEETLSTKNEFQQHSLPLPLRDLYRSDQMDVVNTFFFGADSLHTRGSVSDLGYMAMMAKIHALAYNDAYFQKYDNYRDLKNSGGPKVDQELCIQQLTNLTVRAKLHYEEKYSSKDVNFHQYIDTFGRAPSGMLLGHSVLTGMYTECLRLRIKSTDEVEEIGSETRYCVLSFKHKNWPEKGVLKKYASLKVGVCLPRSCDSTNYKNKFQLVEELFAFNAREVDKDQASVLDLYCLPDKESSLRIWWKSRETLAFVCVLTIWFSILAYSTFKYEKLSRSSHECKRIRRSESSFGLTGGFQAEIEETSGSPKAQVVVAPQQHPHIKIYQSLSVIDNLRMLFNTTKASSLMETANEEGASLGKQSEEEKLIKKLGPVVDLRVLEGIKVLCMCYVIMGHVLMCLTLVISNGRELTSVGWNNISVFISNLVPAFAVNSFFTITGILTTYLLFKNKQSKSLINDGKKWSALILYRYLRIMPMYIVVVAYTKYLAKYAGEGPFWDYATSSLSARGRCEQESWLWTLLFGANFKPPLDHCIPSAWYLANDFQFFIVTPIFLAALHKSPKFGRKLLKFCIIAGYLAGFMSIILSEAEDLRPVVSFEPHGFKTYVTFLSSSYTRPQYRIPAYLCGLLIGYALFEFEQNKIKYLIAKAKEEGEEKEEKEVSGAGKFEKPDWSESFKKYGLLFSILCVLSCCALPFLSSFFHFNKLFAKIFLALFMSSYHIMFSLSVGLYVLLSTTGYSNNFLTTFLTASFWKPLARLSLCVVLINVEVIIYVLHTSTQMYFLTFNSHMATNLICIVYTYLIAIVVCVLFEAPMRAALNHSVGTLMTRIASKKKTC